MIDKILKIADENPDGFTISLNFEIPASGYVVAEKETQNSFGVEGLKKVIEYAKANRTFIGGWKEKKQYYFDASKIYNNKDEAIKAGIENEQIAIYDLNNDEVIYI
jgi:fructokinase